MHITIKVITNAKQNRIKEEGEGLKVYTTARAVEGRANEAVRRLLAAHFGVKTRQIVIIKGLQSRQKTIKINSFESHPAESQGGSGSEKNL